jgi:hypothetical protein
LPAGMILELEDNNLKRIKENLQNSTTIEILQAPMPFLIDINKTIKLMKEMKGEIPEEKRIILSDALKSVSDKSLDINDTIKTNTKKIQFISTLFK